MPFIRFVTRRFLGAVRQERFLTFLTCVSVGGIGISVFAFLIIHAVMNGFTNHLHQVLVGFHSHIEIEGEAPVDLLTWLGKQPEVQEAIPVVETDAILETDGEATGGVHVRGMKLSDLGRSTSLKITYFADEGVDSLVSQKNHVPGILVGEDLYTRLKFLPSEEEIIRLVNPVGDIGPEGELQPLTRSFRIVGVFTTGFYDYDNQYTIAHLAEASRLAGAPKTRILVTLTDLNHTDSFAALIRKNWPAAVVSTWTERNQRLFSALKLERHGMFILLSMVTLIACFNVLALVTLLTLSRRREVALFQSMGLPRSHVNAIFTLVGLTLGVVGTGIGFIAGGLVLGWLEGHPLPLPPAYYLDTLPVQVDPLVVLLILILGPLFAMLASLWPAFAAGRVQISTLLKES